MIIALHLSFQDSHLYLMSSDRLTSNRTERRYQQKCGPTRDVLIAACMEAILMGLAQIDPDSTTIPGFVTTKWEPPQKYPYDHSKRAESEGKSDFYARGTTCATISPVFSYIYICT